MNIRLNSRLASGYKNPAQRTRVITEAWGGENLFCPNCPSPALDPTTANTPAIDFICLRCRETFQLKGSSRLIGHRLLDGAYATMMEAVLSQNTPNLYILQYDRTQWIVRHLLLIPHFVFTASSIEKRRPLSATARRAGWVGCNILLSNLPLDAKIPLVQQGSVIPSKIVRKKYRQLQPLKELTLKERGWTLDVLWAVRSLGKEVFTNSDLYAYERHFARLHPHNRHIRDKIRQQLQVLRDSGFLRQVSRGVWEVA